MVLPLHFLRLLMKRDLDHSSQGKWTNPLLDQYEVRWCPWPPKFSGPVSNSMEISGTMSLYLGCIFEPPDVWVHLRLDLKAANKIKLITSQTLLIRHHFKKFLQLCIRYRPMHNCRTTVKIAILRHLGAVFNCKSKCCKISLHMFIFGLLPYAH